MITVMWRGVDGSEWVLDGPRDSIGQVVLTGVSGLVGVLDRVSVLRSTGVGVLPVGSSGSSPTPPAE